MADELREVRKIVIPEGFLGYLETPQSGKDPPVSETSRFVLPVVHIDSLLVDGPPVWEKERHRARGVVLRGSSGTPDHERILSFARTLGTPIEPVVGLNRDPNRLVHDVRPLGAGMFDKLGRVVRSTSFQSIDLHTDGYNAETPPTVVILQVVIPGTGGVTTIASVGEIVERLRPETVDLLSQPDYPTATGITAILSRDSQDWSMRYNAYELQALLSDHRNTSRITNAHVGALSELAEIVDYQESRGAGRIHLLEGDVVVLDNTALLNGRLTLQPNDAEHLLHRVWCV